MDTTRRLLGSPLWSGDGYARACYTRVVDPGIVRCLDVGQAAYIYRGGVTYLQVKRLAAGAAELPGPAGAATGRAAPGAHRTGTAGTATRRRAPARRGLRQGGAQMTPGTAGGGWHIAAVTSPATCQLPGRPASPDRAGPVRGGIS